MTVAISPVSIIPGPLKYLKYMQRKKKDPSMFGPLKKWKKKNILRVSIIVLRGNSGSPKMVKIGKMNLKAAPLTHKNNFI